MDVHNYYEREREGGRGERGGGGEREREGEGEREGGEGDSFFTHLGVLFELCQLVQTSPPLAHS